MPNSPVLWGPNNTALNLQNQEQLATGELIQNDGPKNLITYNRFENGLTTGWSLGTTGTLTNGIPTGTPTFGSGASGTLALTAASTTPIDGTYSLSYADSAATTAGNMVATQAYTVQPGLQAKVLTFKFSYQAFANASNGNFSGTSSNSFGVACYDVTNSSWLPVAGNFAMTQNSGVGVATGTMQTNITTASVRFVVYNANATAGAITMYFDGFSLGPQTAPIGTVATDWVKYNPTFGAGFGTVTTQAFYSRRVADSLEVNGYLITGTVAASAPTFTLGFNGANGNVGLDGNKMNGSAICGDVSTNTTPSATLFTFTVASPAASGGNAVQFGVQTSTLRGSDILTSATLFGTGTFVFVNIKVPIAGWSSNVQMSNDTDTRVISWDGNAASQALTANVTNVAFTSIVDRAGSWNGTQYTIPVSGDYVVFGNTAMAAAGVMQVYVNGSVTAGGSWTQAGSATVISGCTPIFGLSAGTTVSLRCTTSQTIASGLMAIYRLSGPAVIAASESVNARYNSSVSSVSGSPASVVFTTKNFDSHNAYSGGVYTIPVSGKYAISAALNCPGTYVLNNQMNVWIYKNGSIYSQVQRYASGAVTAMDAEVSDIVDCLAGDAIVIRLSNSGTTPTISGSGTTVYFSIARVGN